MMTTSRYFKLIWIVPIALVVLAGIVLAAKGIRASDGGQQFLKDYPGESTLPSFAPVGFPIWVNVQHFLSALFIMFIVRSGWQIRTMTRPTAFWTRNNTGLITTKNPPVRIGLQLWFHLSVNTLWVINGLLFYVLIFSTGQWTRVIPVSWDVFPNALSAGLQYASLQWPVENGWINYNGLQLITYFITIFIAAPLAVITGVRMAPGLAGQFRRIEKVYPIELARKIHFPVMLWFVGFIIVHVTLVLATGALRNLNHMYAARDDQSWWGFGIFAASMIVMIIGWIAARPVLLGSAASLTGSIRR